MIATAETLFESVNDALSTRLRDPNEPQLTQSEQAVLLPLIMNAAQMLLGLGHKLSTGQVSRESLSLLAGLGHLPHSINDALPDDAFDMQRTRGHMSPRGDRPTFVYYLLNAANNSVKIGYSVNPKVRRAIIMAGADGELTLIAQEDGNWELERDRHRQFSDLSIHGEWFRYEGELKTHIEELTHGAPQT